MRHVLEVDSILKQFGDRNLLTDCYLKCGTGDIIGLLGRNGSGKSTLLKIIFGTEPALNKNIRIDGRQYQHAHQHKKLIAYLPQQRFLPKDLPIKRIIHIFIGDRSTRQQIMEHERIRVHLDKKVYDLSGGELRYLELLLLLHLPVKFILLDEPFSGIEPIYREQVAALIHTHSATRGFIITDHDYRNIISTSKQLVLLHNGACRQIQALEELEYWHYLPPGTVDEVLLNYTGSVPLRK